MRDVFSKSEREGGCERGWWRERGREVLESLFATIAGGRVARMGRDAPVCCSLGLVLVCWGGCTLHARIFPFGAGQVGLTGV